MRVQLFQGVRNYVVPNLAGYSDPHTVFLPRQVGILGRFFGFSYEAGRQGELILGRLHRVLLRIPT